MQTSNQTIENQNIQQTNNQTVGNQNFQVNNTVNNQQAMQYASAGDRFLSFLKD